MGLAIYASNRSCLGLFLLSIILLQAFARAQKFSPCAAVYGLLSARLSLSSRAFARRNSLRTFAENFLIVRSQTPYAKLHKHRFYNSGNAVPNLIVSI